MLYLLWLPGVVSIFKSRYITEGLMLPSVRWVHFFLLSPQQVRPTEDLPPVKHKDLKAVISYLSLKSKDEELTY